MHSESGFQIALLPVIPPKLDHLRFIYIFLNISDNFARRFKCDDTLP